MTFLAPSRLWLLAAAIALVAAYVVVQRGRRVAVRHPDLGLLDGIVPRWAGWRRHVSAGALLLAITGLVVGLARPAHTTEVRRHQAVVVLALDVSKSMNATDVAPTRLLSAVAAARDFVKSSPKDHRIGLVAFDEGATTLASPSTDRSAILSALDRVARQEIRVPKGLATGTTPAPTGAGAGLGRAVGVITKDAAARGATRATKPYSAVVLLADGAKDSGRSLSSAARTAATQRVPVFTIAYGTASGTVTVGGTVVPVPADPGILAQVAKVSGGADFTAATSAQLRGVYDHIGTTIGTATRQVELTLPLATLAAMLLVVALGATMVWSPRLA
ncbi:MAG: hypothetical protein JWM05_3611 [Acidimicrobiales bacterium]|nr:hypothetical protein [Acidimicrobiales bacterium]